MARGKRSIIRRYEVAHRLDEFRNWLSAAHNNICGSFESPPSNAPHCRRRAQELRIVQASYVIGELVRLHKGGCEHRVAKPRIVRAHQAGTGGTTPPEHTPHFASDFA